VQLSAVADNGPVEIRELRAFVAVLEEGGLSAAARRLHVSQSAISQTVQSLERQLGTALLVRDHAGSRATPQGELLAREARQLIEQHDRAVSLVTGQGRRAPGIVRLGVPLEFPSDVLPRTLAWLALERPELKVVLRHDSSAAQLAALAAGDLDIALTRDLPGDPAYDAVLVVHEAMGAILARSVAAEVETGGKVPLHRLARLEWVGFSRSETPAWHDQVSAILRGHGVTAVVDRSDSRPVTPEVKLAAVAAGTAFGLAAPGWGPPLPDELGWYPLVDDPIIRRTWAVWHADSTSRHIAAVLAALEPGA
jgi:DNA-binding transcriptional LysR family regulator